MTISNWIGSISAPFRLNLSARTVFDTVLTWIERTQQRRALARMDDHLLSDIGLSRADIARECDKAFWQD